MWWKLRKWWRCEIWHRISPKERKRRRYKRFRQVFGHAAPWASPYDSGVEEYLVQRTMERLVEAGTEAEATQIELEEHRNLLRYAGDLPHAIMIQRLIYTKGLADRTRNEYEWLRRVARRAGFSKAFLLEADTRAKEEANRSGVGRRF